MDDSNDPKSVLSEKADSEDNDIGDSAPTNPFSNNSDNEKEDDLGNDGRSHDHDNDLINKSPDISEKEQIADEEMHEFDINVQNEDKEKDMLSESGHDKNSDPEETTSTSLQKELQNVDENDKTVPSTIDETSMGNDSFHSPMGVDDDGSISKNQEDLDTPSRSVERDDHPCSDDENDEIEKENEIVGRNEVNDEEKEDPCEKDKESEGEVRAEEPGESEDVCLIPDNDEELTGAEKEQAILARQNAEKRDQESIEIEDSDPQATSNEDPSTEDPSIEDPSNDEIDTIVEAEGEAEEQTENAEETQKITITSIVHCDKKCDQCGQQKSCEYRYKNIETGNYSYFCEISCIEALTTEKKQKFFIRRKKYMVEDVIEEIIKTCILCKEHKSCRYNFKQDEDILFICNDDCFNLLTKEEPDKLRLKRNSIRVKDLTNTTQNEPEPKIISRTAQEAEIAKLERETSFIRRCVGCSKVITLNQENLQWQVSDFCNQLCLGKYQNQVGGKCHTCNGPVSHQSLGKYCVRFGFDICQFCCASCLDKYKKRLKNCSYCQKDISSGNEGFLAPVGDNEQFKDFCSQPCMRNYDILLNPKGKNKFDQCSVCNNKKLIRVEIILDNREHYFCSNPCFSAFKFVNNIVPDQCAMCTKYFERKSNESYTIYKEKKPDVFCGQICMNMFITQNRKIIFCQWCKVKKYNFDMITKPVSSNETLAMCSINCLVLYGVSLTAISKQKMKCDYCLEEKTPQYHLTMSDSSIRNFCTYQCVMQFQSKFSRAPLTLDGENEADTNSAPFPTGLPKRVKPSQTMQISKSSTSVPVISEIRSLGSEIRRNTRRGNRKQDQIENIEASSTQSSSTSQSQPTSHLRPSSRSLQPVVSLLKLKPTKKTTIGTMTTESGTKTAIIAVPPLPPKVTNKNTMCRPITESKGVTCKPLSFNIGCQTDEDMSAKILIPVPVPIYVPEPMYMYSAPFPVPVPIPLPIPVPIFIPTTRNSANGIMKEIRKIQDKMPSDPYEAELLMMAEMVAGDKKKDDSDSDDDDEIGQDVGTVAYANSEVIVDANNSFGEDVLQMALKMATEYDEPAVDLESAMTANTITQPPPGSQMENEEEETPLIYHQMQMHDTPRPGRGRKRLASNVTQTGRNNRITNTGNKRQRRTDVSVIHQPDPVMSIAPSPTPPSQIITQEKPDANMCLKYTFGVNAWKQWVMTKNADLEKSSIRRKPFKLELLQMTADELNYSLCLFVKEVRKPNGTEYAPDTIYYLVLGIQQYLYENGRIDNIFTDPYYERFTDCLDDVAKKFSILYNDSQYIVTRVEEEHLWECKQLGAHSPHVLLSTLMFFNTKHFNLTTVEEHMQLSFSHIMKHWKRNAQGTKAPGSRNVLLRFYPPQSGGDSRKKKVYEQQENEQNPLRCPVRLYEFYLSKCPESVKTRNDVFYLQPERSCVPDSPVWYSTQALSQESLQKMLHRVKMVKEINVALLTI